MVGAGLLAAACGLLSRSAGFLGWAEQRSVDARFALRGHVRVSPRVLAVALDTQSYLQLPLPPLPRGLDAEVIDDLTRAGARVIAFDFALERPSADAEADRRIVGALSRSKHAVVSVTAVGPQGSTALLAGRVPFASVGVQPGVTLLELDSDGAVRRFPLSIGGVPSFALAAARSYRSGLGSSVPAGALIDYPGPAGSVKTIPFTDVLHGHFNPADVSGRIVVVGPTAPVLQDIHRTPVAAAMAGPEIQADAIATALAGYPLRGVPVLTTAVTLLALGLLLPLLTLATGALLQGRDGEAERVGLGPDAGISLIVGLALAASWSVAALVAFEHGAVLDYADGMLTIALASGAVFLLAQALARRERRRLRLLFAASSPEIVERVLQSSGDRPRSLTARTVIAGYRIEEEIGRGGMGVVYRASQLHLERAVALKLIRPDFAESPLYRARFERESRLAARVSHPNIVTVLDAGDDDGLLFLAMQYVDGTNLASVLKGAGSLEPRDAASLIEQVAGALDASHRQMLVHRDVKPANILLRADDPRHALLTDFGLARSITGTDQATQLEGWAGTLDYLAPEQLEGREVDRRADVYALAAVLFHCLTGSVPFPRDETFSKIAAHLNAARPTVTAIVPRLPQTIDTVIARGMAISRADRYPTAGALADAANAILRTPSGPARPAHAAWPTHGEGVSDADPTQSTGEMSGDEHAT